MEQKIVVCEVLRLRWDSLFTVAVPISDLATVKRQRVLPEQVLVFAYSFSSGFPQRLGNLENKNSIRKVREPEKVMKFCDQSWHFIIFLLDMLTFAHSLKAF